MSGLDLNSIQVSYYKIDPALAAEMAALAQASNLETAMAGLKQKIANITKTVTVNRANINAKNILTMNLPLTSGEYVVNVSINDVSGNKGIASRRFKIN